MARTDSRREDMVLQQDLVAAWIERQRSPNTKAAYLGELTAFDSWCGQQASTALRADVPLATAYAAARELAGDSASTLRRRWSALSSFFEFAKQQGAVAANPLTAVARPRASPGNPSTTGQLTPQAVAGYQAIAAALDPRLDLLVTLLVTDGLKLGEALALDIRDVRGRPPKVSLTVGRRTAPTRIWLGSGSTGALYRCIGTRRDGPVFVSGSTVGDEPRRLTRFGADHLIRQLSGDNEERVTTNELRRYHITNSHGADSDLASVRDRAGLAHVRSVRRYLPAEADADD
jgi:integrase/recombinase XerD